MVKDKYALRLCCAGCGKYHHAGSFAHGDATIALVPVHDCDGCSTPDWGCPIVSDAGSAHVGWSVQGNRQRW